MAKINHFGLKLTTQGNLSFNLIRDEYPHTDKFLKWVDFLDIIFNGVREEIEKEDASFSQLSSCEQDKITSLRCSERFDSHEDEIKGNYIHN